jgi:hypothetical protein
MNILKNISIYSLSNKNKICNYFYLFSPPSLTPSMIEKEREEGGSGEGGEGDSK